MDIPAVFLITKIEYQLNFNFVAMGRFRLASLKIRDSILFLNCYREDGCGTLCNMKSYVWFLLLTVVTIVCGGCSIKERTDPVIPTFLDGAPLESSLKQVPFKHAWIAPRDKHLSIKSVFIKPIRTDLLGKDEWKRSEGLAVTSKEEFDKSAAVLARYFRIKLLGELKKVPNPRFEVVETPDTSSLIVEIALTELVLSEPVIRAAALAVPFPGVDQALSAASDPHAAFAARFTNFNGSKLLATAADRRFPPIRIIDLNKLRVTSSAREIIAQWAHELAESIQTDELTTVPRASSFSLLPW